MRKNWQRLFATTATVWLLGACGNGAEESEKQADSPVVDEEVSQDEVDSIVEEKGQDQVAESDKEDTTEAAAPASVPATAPESVTAATALDDDAQLTVSDEQGYAMLVLPAYSLTGEEPGKDSLLLKEDGSVFMRIETVPNDEETYSYLLENMEATIAASANGVQPDEVMERAKLPEGEEIEDVKGYTVRTDSGRVTGLLFKRGDLIVRLTIFDSPDEAYYNDFVKMGQTIELK